VEPPVLPELAHHLADALAAQCPELAERWRERARTVSPRTAEPTDARDALRRTRLCAAVVVSLRGSARARHEVLRAGWELGDAAWSAGASLHHVLRDVDLLSSILLYAAEQAAVEYPDVGAGAGLAVARQLAAGMSVLVVAASRGYMHAHLVDERRRYRALRHDLRNPLGSIKGAVSLMEDQSVTPELRNDPRFRAMVSRNAAALETMIGDRLSDAATLGPALALCDVSLRDVALAVRRDLRAEAAEVGCGVTVAGDLPVVCTDSTSVELALRALVSDALWAAVPGSTVRVALRLLGERAATIAVDSDARRPDAPPATRDALGFAHELSEFAGGRVWEENGSLCLEIALLGRPEALDDGARAD
jgi:signal transduction histidine kinase